MAEITYREAALNAIQEEMRADPRVFVMGQDIELLTWGPDAAREFGSERIRNTPICEAATLGAGIGAALTGMRPVLEMGCSPFLYSAMDQIINQAAKICYMFGGQASVPLVIRATVLYGVSLAAHHCDRPWGLFAHAPGLKIVVPSNAYDVKGLLKASLREGSPVICFSDVNLLGQKAEVPEGDYLVPIGVADVKREGSDVTIVAIAAAVNHSLAAAQALEKEGISAEVVDLRTIVPLDRNTLLRSIVKTGRLIVVDPAPANCGVSAEVSAMAMEHAFDVLKVPVVRLTAPDVPVPFSPSLERLLYPTPESIATAVRKMFMSRASARINPERVHGIASASG